MSKRKTWKKWDTFYYKIESENKLINNRYLLFVKVDDTQWYDKKFPVFRVLITKDNKLPTSFEEVNNLEHVQTSQLYWYERWFSTDLHNLNCYQIVKERCNMKYYPDELHFLKIYLAAIWIDGRKSIPDNWHYLGNYPITNLPKDEFIPYTESKIEENCYYWHWYDTGRNDIKRMTQKYLDYNLKGIYPNLKKNIKKTKKASMLWAMSEISMYLSKKGGVEKNEKEFNELLDIITTIDGKIEDLDIRKELTNVIKTADKNFKLRCPEFFDENGNCIC